jgi:uncharacterized membrane protein YfcA
VKYVIISIAAFLLRFIFSLAGIGSSTAMVAILAIEGYSFNIARATALFINIFSMLSANIRNAREKKLDVKHAAPLAISSLIFSPIGAYSTLFIPESYVKTIFVLFLIYSATSIIIMKAENEGRKARINAMLAIGSTSGFIGGMLGIGGGVIAISIFILLGYSVRDVISSTPLMVLASSISGFIAYYLISSIDLILLLYLAPLSMAGGWIGTHMCFKINERSLRGIVSIILYFLAFRILLQFI